MIHILIYAFLAFITVFGGVLAKLVAFFWIGIGLTLVAKTESRGLLADIAFVANWPLHFLWEKRP